MTNKELIHKLKQTVAAEKSLTLEVIKLLSELDKRKCYVELGFSSLFDFATRELGYEESAAVRRIKAARLLQEIPSTHDKIANGDLHLSVVVQAASFFRKTGATNKQEVLDMISNKSTRQAAKILADLAPEVPKPEKTRELGQDKVELKIVISEDLKLKLQTLKSKFSHINPSMNYAELLEILADKALKKIKSKKSPSAPKVTKGISQEIKRQVFERDKGTCSYANCQSKHLLQYDHIRPRAFGGEHTLNNLRLLCFAHHKLVTEKVFSQNQN
jgi:hypothetical protein